jgi:AcrR family transcriptional regulator
MSASTTAPAPRRGAPAEETRQRIEDTAERLFRTMGYQKTAVADIARELGMSPANVYRFYSSKSAINEAIAARMLGGVEAEVWKVARGSGPAPERLREVIRTLHRRHLGLFFSERRLHDMVTAAMAEHWGVVERFIGACTSAVRHVVVDGISSGAFARRDPEVAAKSIKQATLTFIHPVLISECIGRGVGEEEIASDLEAVLDLLLNGLMSAR